MRKHSSNAQKTLCAREELLQKVTEQKTFQQAMMLVRDYADYIDQELRRLQTAPSGKREAAMALEYIRRNYMDTDLSLNSICSYLNISTSHFSTIFKEVTGETFVEALTRLAWRRRASFWKIRL